VQGRILYLKIENSSSGETLDFFSVYAKSNISRLQAENFLKKIDDEITENKLENVVLCGDFNFVTSTNDRNSNTFSQTDNDYRTFWDNFQIKNDLIDVFRYLYPKRRIYSYNHTDGKSKSRIDRLYVTSNLIAKFHMIKFENTNVSDHKIKKAFLANSVKMGRGTWIFNKSLLNDPNYTLLIKELIDSYTQGQNQPIPTFPNYRIAFEFLKMEIKSQSINFSINKAKKEKQLVKMTQKKLEILEAIPKDKLNRNTVLAIEGLKNKIEEQNHSKIIGHHIRSKIPHFEEGEGDISYFSKLEKRVGEENTIFSLEDDSGQIMEGTDKVSKLACSFMEKLYKSEPEDIVDQNCLLEKVDKN